MKALFHLGAEVLTVMGVGRTVWGVRDQVRLGTRLERGRPGLQGTGAMWGQMAQPGRVGMSLRSQIQPLS